MKFRLTHWLPDHSRKPRAQTKQHKQPPLHTTTTNLPVRCAFWDSDKCRTSVPWLYLLSSIRTFFFMQRNLIDVLIFPINTFLEDATTSFKSTCATLEVLDKYRYDSSSARYAQKAGHESMLVAVILSLSLQCHFNRLKMKPNICHAPLLARFTSASFWRQLNVCHVP